MTDPRSSSPFRLGTAGLHLRQFASILRPFVRLDVHEVRRVSICSLFRVQWSHRLGTFAQSRLGSNWIPPGLLESRWRNNSARAWTTRELQLVVHRLRLTEVVAINAVARTSDKSGPHFCTLFYLAKEAAKLPYHIFYSAARGTALIRARV